MSLIGDSITWMDSVLLGDEFAESAIYTPIAGDPVSLNVLFQYGGLGTQSLDGVSGDGNSWVLSVERDYRGGFGSKSVKSCAYIMISASDVSSPEYGDTIAFSGEIWTVREVLSRA